VAVSASAAAALLTVAASVQELWQVQTWLLALGYCLLQLPAYYAPGT
jgi:hypothetical protein